MGPKVFVGTCNVGRGVFAARRFLPGDLILTFSGEQVHRDNPVHFTPLASNLLQTGISTYIVPLEPGVFVNHSCDPNAGISKNRRLVALCEILPGEEVRFDYSTTMDDGIWSMECRCGAPTCRTQIVDFRDLPAELQDHYLKLGMVSGFIARRYRERLQTVLAAPWTPSSIPFSTPPSWQLGEGPANEYWAAATSKTAATKVSTDKTSGRNPRLAKRVKIASTQNRRRQI